MTRMLSTFATAGWTGYHAVCAFVLAVPSTSLAANTVLAGAALTSAAHAILAIGALAAGAMFQAPAERLRGEALALGVLALGIALSAAVSLAGEPAAAPGLYASCVTLTLGAFAFDRFFGSEGFEDEVDHDAFMRYAAELGAEMGGADEVADRRTRPLR